MQTIEVDKIRVAEDRQRKEGKSPKDLEQLKKGILSKGLMHAIGISYRNDEPWLVFGECRLLCIKELHQDGLPFLHNNEAVPSGHIPYTNIGTLSPEDFEETELEENVLRANLSWQEEAAAKVKILELRKIKDPTSTATEVAKEIVAIQQKENVSAESERKTLVMMKTVTENMHLPSVKNAKTLNKAYHTALDLRKQDLESKLLRLSPLVSPHNIIHGDCREQLKLLAPNTFDVILSDPPYGIDADKMKKDVMHLYDDSKENALGLYQTILREGFRILKPQGTVFLFCDVEHFITIRTLAESMLYSTWRTPIIWQKGTEGHAPWGKNGFVRTYETILYAVKGQRDLAIPGGPDVRTIKRSTVGDKLHAAEKPPEVLRWLLQLATRKGNKVLDPCCGSGPIFPAAKGLDIQVTGIEISEQYYNAACSRLVALDQEAAPESVVAHKKTLDDVERDLGISL